MLERLGRQRDGTLPGEAAAPKVILQDLVEDALIALAIEGDEAAFTRLYDTHYDRVHRYIRYRVRHIEDAEDLTQKVFLQAWRGLGRYRRTGSPFIAWLITIAHNVTMSFFRSRKLDEQLPLDLSEDGEGAMPAEAPQDRGGQELVREAILQLGSDQQQVITMKFLEGFEYDEIAGALGKSEGNVRVIQHRALQQLRKLLGRGESQ